MAIWHYFVAVFTEPADNVFKKVSDIWDGYDITNVKKMTPTAVDFEMTAPLEEGAVLVSGKVQEDSSKSILTLHNLTSSDWIGINKTSKKLVEFCLKTKPEIAYVYYAGSMQSPHFVFFTKKEGLLVDIRLMNILHPDDKSKKTLEDCFGKRMRPIAAWEDLAKEGPLMPAQKCKIK